MALFTPGPVVGQISGRVGGTIFSHNAGGTYMRNGTIPTASTSIAALAAKTRLSTCSTQWAAITAAQRLAWKYWAADNPIINRLGASRVLGANAAFIQLNTRLLNAGQATIADPPQGAAPPALESCTLLADIGAGSFGLTFAATPLGADDMLYLWASVVDSAAINYVENTKRFIGVSAAAQASPFDCQSQIEAVFGDLVDDQSVHVFAQVLDSATGLISGPVRCTDVVLTSA